MKPMRIYDLGEATVDNYKETRRSLLRKADELTLEIAAKEPIRTMADIFAKQTN